MPLRRVYELHYIACHTCTVVSSLPDAIILPLGDQATASAGALEVKWPQ